MFLCLFTLISLFVKLSFSGIAVIERIECAMQKTTNQENLIIVFFVVTLILSSIYIIVERCFVDIIYFGVLVYYFVRFLIIKCKGV